MKKGQSLVSILTDSMASAPEMGTGDDLIIAAEISDNGSARRLREDGVAVVEPAGPENNIHMLSATPPSRPNKHFRRVSS